MKCALIEVEEHVSLEDFSYFGLVLHEKHLKTKVSQQWLTRASAFLNGLDIPMGD